ncbi:GbsR/MarR family transcriptional regulator [Rhodohalobacter sp. 614A]|uniref:GbsR/MarR family transcriptional regulator n=1 Tax=Rhodohalobacter sp. 614A TaxID=2908649 RepID=UPI001F2055FC
MEQNDSLKSDTHQQAIDQFVLLWGEMASAWGINKTMAQIHALLYAESEPLDTDAIMKQLSISRGNANMNLRNLLHWQLVQKVHYKGERRDFYTAEKDVWNIVAILIRERHQREIEPIKDNLTKTLEFFEEDSSDEQTEAEFKERLENFIEFLEMFDRFTKALLPYINKKNLTFLKHLVKLAEAHQSLKGNKPVKE